MNSSPQDVLSHSLKHQLTSHDLNIKDGQRNKYKPWLVYTVRNHDGDSSYKDYTTTSIWNTQLINYLPMQYLSVLYEQSMWCAA